MGNAKCMEMLIEMDVELARCRHVALRSVQRLNFSTMLKMAAGNGHTEVIAVLMRYGADVIVGSTYETPLAMAAYCLQVKAVELLFRHYDTGAVPFAPIFMAIRRSRSSMTPKDATAQQRIIEAFSFREEDRLDSARH